MEQVGCLRKTRMCPSMYTHTGCKHSPAECRYAHDKLELRSVDHQYYKITQCAFYQRGKCRNGDRCTFAHGETDLRSAADESSPPPPAAAVAQVPGPDSPSAYTNPETLSTDCGSSDYCWSSPSAETTTLVPQPFLSYSFTKLHDGLSLSLDSSYED